MNDRASHLPDRAASPVLTGATDAALPTGMRLGAFEIQRVLSRSANAVVYLATDHALALPVAIQEYLPAHLMRRDAGLRLVAAQGWHEELIARGLRAFVDDARMLARCEHPALMRVHQLFHVNGSAYRVMPVCMGQRLSELRREMAGPPDEAALRALLDGLLGAIEAIHLSGQVHGGVRAENILLLADDRPLLLGAGAAGRELGIDLVASLMETLGSPAEAHRSPEMGSAPTGAALDLFMLADVMRWCITAPASASADTPQEPLGSQIARAFAADTRPQYSAALIGALDAAVSPFAQHRPLSAAQFRDWLARGVPEVPGGSLRGAPPAARTQPATVRAAVPVPGPKPEGRRPAAVVAALPVAPPAPPPPPPPPRSVFDAAATAAPAESTIAPWPQVVRAIDPPPTAPLPRQLQRLTNPRRRRYQWLLGSALAALAAGVLVIATGAWNRAPDIPLGPDAQRVGAAGPRAVAAAAGPAPPQSVHPPPVAGAIVARASANARAAAAAPTIDPAGMLAAHPHGGRPGRNCPRQAHPCDCG